MSQYRNAHLRVGSVLFRWARSSQCWGQIKVFVDLRWEGETVRLAVVRPQHTINFIAEILRLSLQFCPMVVSTQKNHTLQIMNVRAITAVAGRIRLSEKPRRTEVIFETSLDLQRAEMSFA